MNWVDWLPVGDTITASSWIVPAGITAASTGYTTTTTTVWLTGGKAGQRYVLTNRIVTADGRTEDRSFEVPVTET